MDGAGEAEFERGRSDKSQFGVHTALSAPLESLSGMMRPNPIIIRTPQRSNSHQIRPGTNPQRQQLIRERQMSQRLSAEQRKEEQLQAMRTRDAMRAGTQADRLPPISQAGTGSHRLAYADASVQRERQLLETRMQLGMPAESGLSRAYQVMGDGQSPVDFKVAADSARRLQSEMHLSMAEASTLRKLQQLQHQQNQLQRQVTPRLASQPRSRSASGRLNGDSLSSVSLPPIGNGVMTQGQPAPRATQEQHRQTEDIGMKVQSWHDLSRLSNFADQKHTKEATGSDQQIPVKHRTSDESQEEDQTIESSETSQARQHPTPQKLKRTIDASKVLEQPERYHTYERKAPNPTQEVLAPKETFNNRADEAEFRRLTKARLAKLSKHDREAMRRAAKARQALREAAEREKQKQMENKRAKMPPKPMDTQKLKIQENALRNHERRVADHQSVCAKVAEKANKSEEQLLMRIAGEEVERSQMAKAMTVGMPMYDDRRRYLRGVEFFHQRHQLGTDVGGIHMSPTKKERCIIPEPELVGKPLNIPGNTDASRRQSRWAAAPYTSLMWTDMEKLLWEVNAILDHKPEFDRLATRGRSMKRPVTSGADSKWAVSRGDTAAVSAPRGPLEPARSGGWRPKSSPAAAVTDKHRVPRVTGDERSLAQMTGNADNDQLLKAVNDRRRKEGKKAIARLPTQWKKMSSFDEGTAKAHVYARKDTQNRTSLQLAMEDPAKVRAGVAQISDIRRWHPYTPWFGGRPVSENNPAPFVEKANEDPEGLMPRLGCARPKLDRSRKRSHASHQQDGGAPPMSGVSQDDTLDTTISAYAASDQRLPGRTTRNMLLEAIIKDSTKRFAVDLGKSPDTGNNSGLEAVDSLSVQDGTDAPRGDIAAGDGHKDTNASPSEVFQQLSRGLKSESARALRLKDASQKLLQYQQDLDHQAGQTKADVVDGEQKPAKGPSKEKEQAYYALVGNKIVFTKTMTKAKQSKDTAAAKRSYWHPDVASEVPKILVGEHEFAYCGEPEDAVEASSQASEKKVVVYGEAMVGEVILLPLPFHNNSNTRVDFELLEREENNSLGTHYAQNQDIYIIFCQQCQRTTVQGDLGDILFGFCAGRPGLFRQTFHMHFTPRLEGGRHVVVEVYGHALEPQASALAKLALPQLPSETMPLAPATASGRAPEYKLIRRARHQFEREDELDRQALQMAGVPYQLSEDEIQRAGDLDFITDIVDDLVACVVDRPESQPLVRRQEEEDILFEVNPSLQLVHMNLVPTLETMHALATNAPEDEEALAEAGLATPKPAEGKAGVKSAKTGKGKDKDKDKKGGKGAKAAEPPPADKPVELQMDINPNAVWDYRIPTLHELILKPVQPAQEDKRKRCAELYEKVSVSTNDPHLENDSGTIREDLLDVHQRTTSFMRLLLEGLVDTVADTCTTLRHQMNLPLGDMGDDAAQAKDMTSPEKGAGPDKGKGKGGQKKPEPKRKESKLAKDTKDAKKKDAGKGKGKTDAAGKQDGVQSDGAKDAANEDKTLVDPEKLAWFRDLAYLQVRDKISEMLDGVSAVEAEIEPELKLPDFAPMLDAELGVIAEPIDVGDVFGSIHDEVCYINPLKPKSSSEMFKKLLNAAKLDRVDIVKGKVQAYDKAKIDPSKEVRFEP
ncbi:uncharacterized protein LOC135818328 [Sycon ciliatum]|uniref:uncharacterized protein LOC135818328 n=1 Tax=Sycon ciliatum TaxID=27933 RepID=UPI0031F71EEE